MRRLDGWRRRRMPAAGAAVWALAPVLVFALFAAGLPVRRGSRAQRPPAAGARVVTLAAGQARASGLRWAPLRRARRRREAPALGLVLSAAPLVPLRRQYLAALQQAAAARAQLRAASQEYQRLQRLYAHGRNAALKAVQAAAAAEQAARANWNSARQAAALTLTAARQGWGPVVARWLGAARPPAAWAGIMGLRDYLVQITPPAGVAAPPRAYLRAEHGGGRMPARLVSKFPSVNPRLQAPAYLYLAPAAHLAAGLSMTARLPLGAAQAGVAVPRAAVLYWRGRRWFFLRLGPRRFQLRRLARGVDVPGGVWLPAPQLAGRPVVVAGGEVLLTQLGANPAGGGD